MTEGSGSCWEFHWFCREPCRPIDEWSLPVMYTDIQSEALASASGIGTLISGSSRSGGEKRCHGAVQHIFLKPWNKGNHTRVVKNSRPALELLTGRSTARSSKITPGTLIGLCHSCLLSVKRSHRARDVEISTSSGMETYLLRNGSFMYQKNAVVSLVNLSFSSQRGTEFLFDWCGGWSLMGEPKSWQSLVKETDLRNFRLRGATVHPACDTRIVRGLEWRSFLNIGFMQQTASECCIARNSATVPTLSTTEVLCRQLGWRISISWQVCEGLLGQDRETCLQEPHFVKGHKLNITKSCSGQADLSRYTTIGGAHPCQFQGTSASLILREKQVLVAPMQERQQSES